MACLWLVVSTWTLIQLLTTGTCLGNPPLIIAPFPLGNRRADPCHPPLSSHSTGRTPGSPLLFPLPLGGIERTGLIGPTWGRFHKRFACTQVLESGRRHSRCTQLCFTKNIAPLLQSQGRQHWRLNIRGRRRNFMVANTLGRTNLILWFRKPPVNK